MVEEVVREWQLAGVEAAVVLVVVLAVGPAEVLAVGVVVVEAEEQLA